MKWKKNYVYCGNYRKNRKFPQKKWGNWKKSCLVENIGKSENFHTQSINFEWPHDNTYPSGRGNCYDTCSYVISTGSRKLEMSPWFLCHMFLRGPTWELEGYLLGLMDLDLVSIVLEVWSRYPKQIMLIVENIGKTKKFHKKTQWNEKKIMFIVEIIGKTQNFHKKEWGNRKSHV